MSSKIKLCHYPQVPVAVMFVNWSSFFSMGKAVGLHSKGKWLGKKKTGPSWLYVGMELAKQLKSWCRQNYYARGVWISCFSFPQVVFPTGLLTSFLHVFLCYCVTLHNPFSVSLVPVITWSCLWDSNLLPVPFPLDMEQELLYKQADSVQIWNIPSGQVVHTAEAYPGFCTISD